MATAVDKIRCAICNKKAIIKCEGCSKSFCFNDYGNHRQELSKKFDEIEGNRDLIQLSLNETIKEPQNHALLQEINQWELESINTIKQVAEENRKLLLSFTAKSCNRLENELNKLTYQLKQSRQENDFTEADLDQWNKELTLIQGELNKPSNITIHYDSTPFINKIQIDISNVSSTVAPLWIPNINLDAKWVQNGIIVAQKHGVQQEDHGNYSWGVYVDDDQTVYVADYLDHRIMEYKNGATSGQVVAGGNGPGNRNDQLSCPTNVIVDSNSDCLIICDYGNRRVVRWPRRNGTSGETIISNVSSMDMVMGEDGYIYVCDHNKHEVRRWKIGETNGTLVAGGNGPGNRNDQLNSPFFICIDKDLSVYVSDYSNRRVMKWMKGAKEGIVVARDLEPGGIVVDQLGTVYVAHYRGGGVMRWLKGATQGSIVVPGSWLWDLSFDRQNNLYVAEFCYHRVQKFNIEESSR